MPGGVASSFKIDEDGLYINDGVQGGAPSYRNTLLIHKVKFDTFRKEVVGVVKDRFQ